MTNKEVFKDEYTVQLTAAVRDYPQEYAYNVNTVPDVVRRMMIAIERGSFNKDSRAIKATCRKLGIKPTYKAIAEYMKASN